MTARRSLALKIVLSVLVAFAVSLVVTWCVCAMLSTREADRLVNRAFDDVESAIGERVNARLVRQAMAVRERLADGAKTDVASLGALARELRITEICVADANGVIVHSSDPDYLGFDFSKAEGQAAEMMCLLNTTATEFCQTFQPNTAKGSWRKYVAVWRPEGGFVEIGCDGVALRALARSSLVGLSRSWHVGGTGGIVIVTPSGLVLSDYAVPNREGTQWGGPGPGFHWRMRAIDSFPVYVMIPNAAAAVTRNVLLSTTAILNAGALVFVAILVGLVIAAFVRRQIREQTERELKTATDIQLSALPSVFPPFPDKTSFDIYANMKTAREVGGDFYDFYFTGPKTVLFLVADVSGKGVPAAMFMMRAKTLLKSAAQTGKPLADVVTETNDALCEGNEAMMFVTAWVGLLDVTTGRVTYVNAGHNPPVIRREGSTDYLREAKPGLVLGAMAGIPYRAHELTLAPGEAIYLYTDGITEQPNAAGELFGETRLIDLLKKMDGECDQKSMLDGVLKAVTDYADAVDQADDCTQLTIRYRGVAEAVEHEYPPTMEGLSKATADLETALADVPMKVQATLMVAADEIFANIVRYSGATGWTLKVERLRFPDAVRLIFCDDGKPFDPLRQRDPDTTLDAANRTIGGLGILIVKKTMSPVTYARQNGRNVLTMGLTIGA